jgi:uncharacterized membrane protein YhfC
MQVSIFSMIFLFISLIISIGLPIAIFVFLYKKYNAKFLPMIIGAAAFVIFALVLESTVHYFVFKAISLREMPLAYIIYGVLMAGIFEETARFISFHILKKKKYSGISTGLSYGVGHGGIESVLIVGITMAANMVFCIILNTGNIEMLTGKLQGQALEQMNVQLYALINTESYMFLLGGIERIFAVTIQISLSVIVFYSVYSKKIWLFGLAILLHAIFDIPAAAFQVGVIENLLLVEVIVFLCTAAVAALAIYVHKKLKETPHEDAKPKEEAEVISDT